MNQPNEEQKRLAAVKCLEFVGGCYGNSLICMKCGQYQQFCPALANVPGEAGVTDLERIADLESQLAAAKSPQGINDTLKAFADDGDRIVALSGICGCGTIKDGGTCWSCFESYDY